MDIDLNNGYFHKRYGGGSDYNFELYKMVKDFSFIDLCESVRRKDFDNNGSIVVITDKQYVALYNDAYGRGTHEGALARVYKDIHGGGEISNTDEAYLLYKKCTNDYLIAMATFESVELNSHIPLFEGRIIFDFRGKEKKNKRITRGMYESFKKFYNDFNDDIKYVFSKYKFKVIYNYYKDGILLKDSSNSLDNLLNEFSNFINDEIDDTDEIIVGNSVNKNNSK